MDSSDGIETPAPTPRRAPDPGSPRAGLIATIAAFLVIGLVAVIQQTSESPAARAAGAPPSAQVERPVEGPSAQFELISRFLTKVYFYRPTNASDVVSMLDAHARSGADRLRVAMVAGEVQGVAEATARLDDLAAEDPPVGEAVLADASLVRAAYERGLTDEEIGGLTSRHGWFGRLAVTHGLPMTDPVREAVVGGGGSLMMLVGLVAAGLVVVGLVSLALFITALVLMANGTLRRRFVAPAPGGSVAAETVVVFALGFIGLKLSAGALEGAVGGTCAVVFAMLAQWVLIAALFWPLVRGVRIGETMRLWGLHRGRGVVREIAAGVAGYLALLPLLVLGVVVSLVLMLLYQAIRMMMGLHEAPAPENPVLEVLAGKASPWLIVLLGLLASLWAPLVEEAVFRGAMYRQLRGWWHWAPAALVTAVLFGVMHGYPLLMLGPVISLGFGFALLREWRGSLIASMTAHCVHNTAVICVVLWAMRMIQA